MILFLESYTMGAFLVLLQITCIFALGMRTPIASGPEIAIGLQIVGVLLGAWSVYVLRYGLSVFPDVVQSEVLVTAGPYNLLRHPMYTSILLITTGWLITTFDLVNILIWLLLFCVLSAKVYIEEMMLSKHFAEYKQYQQRTWKLIPFLY